MKKRPRPVRFLRRAVIIVLCGLLLGGSAVGLVTTVDYFTQPTPRLAFANKVRVGKASLELHPIRFSPYDKHLRFASPPRGSCVVLSILNSVWSLGEGAVEDLSVVSLTGDDWEIHFDRFMYETERGRKDIGPISLDGEIEGVQFSGLTSDESKSMELAHQLLHVYYWAEEKDGGKPEVWLQMFYPESLGFQVKSETDLNQEVLNSLKNRLPVLVYIRKDPSRVVSDWDAYQGRNTNHVVALVERQGQLYILDNNEKHPLLVTQDQIQDILGLDDSKLHYVVEK